MGQQETLQQLVSAVDQRNFIMAIGDSLTFTKLAIHRR
jgi:hypothetical protein